MFRAGLGTRQCIMSIRCRRTQAQTCMYLLGAHHFQVNLASLFSLEAPMRQNTVSHNFFIPNFFFKKSNFKCLTFSPGSPTNPWGPGKPCRRNGALMFLCIYHICELFLRVSALCSYQDSRVALLSRCSNVSWGSLLQTGNDVMGSILLSNSTVCYRYYTHEVSLWSLNPVNSSNALRREGKLMAVTCFFLSLSLSALMWPQFKNILENTRALNNNVIGHCENVWKLSCKLQILILFVGFIFWLRLFFCHMNLLLLKHVFLSSLTKKR